MAKKFILLHTLVIVCLLLGTINSQCPMFYTDVNQQGNSFQLCSSGNVPGQYNNQTSSFFVPVTYSVTLYSDVDYQGQVIGPYTQGTYNVPDDFNDRLNSVMVKKVQPLDPNCVIFYARVDQLGSGFQMCSSGNVSTEYDNPVLSFVVPAGYSVTLFPDYNYGGQSVGPYTQGAYNIPENFNYQLSSVAIEKASLQPQPQNSSCATFYSSSDEQGNSFQLCSSGDLPSKYNDHVSSFVVPAGISLILYSDAYFGRRASGPYTQGIYNVPAGFDLDGNHLKAVTINIVQPQPQNPNCVTFFTDVNEQGETFQLCSSGDVPSQYDDQASSFIVPAGYSVTLYPDYNYGGQPVGPYTQGIYNVPDNFTHQLSSAAITIPQNQQNQNCVTFYTDANIQGDNFQLCSNGDVPSQYNNRVSSFVVPAGYSVTLYPNYNYGGQRLGPYTQGTYKVSDDFPDPLGSVVITLAPSQPRNSSCVTFYTNANEKGNSFQLCSSGDVPSQYNDQVSSFVVPSGYSVTLYPEYNYEGKAIGPYTQGIYNVPTNFSNQLSSAAINRAQTQLQPLDTSCVTFYTAVNETGNSFQLCSSGNLPSQYNGQVLSLVVPAGSSVTLYSEPNYKGLASGPYTRGSYNVSYANNPNSQFNSVIISLAINYNCPNFYTDANQQGNSFQLCYSGAVPTQFNDQVSSFTVPSGYSVILYSGTGQTVGPYAQGKYNVPDSFDHQLRSAVITIPQLQPEPHARNSSCVTFYTEVNTQGDSFQLCFGGDVPSQYNDQVSSFVIPVGYSVTLYPDYNYGGQPVGPYIQGTYNIPHSFTGQLSSATIAISQPQNSSCVTIYNNLNAQGDSFQLCSSGDVPSQYKYKIWSFAVPAGHSAILYADYNYGGQSIGPYAQGTYNVPGYLMELVNSVAINIALPQPQNSSCVTFYTDTNEQGDSFQLCFSGDVPIQYRYQISSFVVPANYSVTLFLEYNYGGQAIGSFTQGTYNVPDDFNDKLASAAINRAPPQNSSCVTFNTNKENSFLLCSTGNLPSQHNSKVLSFVVPAGYSVILYSDPNYGGVTTGPYTKGRYNVPQNFSGQLSSVIINLADNPKCPTFYTDANIQGDSFQLCSNGDVPSQYNDQASSFVVPRGYSVILYSDASYGGQSVGPYTQGIYNLPDDFDDQLSSALITVPQPQNSSCVTLFTDFNELGNSFQLCSSGNVPSQYNHQVSSWIIPANYSVTLYPEYNFGGQPVGPYTQGTYNAPDSFNDQLSSVVIQEAQPYNSSCVTFYTDNDEQGQSFQLCFSGNVPIQYDNQVSSFVVPADRYITLYPDENYEGQSVGPYAQGTYNSPNNFNDQLSSVTVHIGQPPNPNCATFYTDANEHGDSFQLCFSADVPSQYNNQVSSFVVPANYSVTLYPDYNYGGQPIGPYTQGTYNILDNFTDQLSSVAIKIITTHPQNPDCILFYTDTDENGDSFQLCSSGDVPSQYDDQGSWFIVPAGYSVTLYPDYNYGGQPVGPYPQGTYHVPDDFYHQLSSIVITLAQPTNTSCVTFYTNADENEDSFQLCSSGDVPSQYNDQVSSFVVPSGYSVTLYPDYNYEGKAIGPYTQGTYSVPTNFSNQLSSVAIDRAQTQSQPLNTSCVTFYTAANETGDNFQLCSSGNVPSQYNDKVGSFNVPAGSLVILYSDNDYEGHLAGPYTQGRYNVSDNIEGQVSSVIISLAINYNCPTFYTDANQQGNSFQLCYSGAAPTQYNGQVSSFNVPAGYSVILYSQAAYRGQTVGPYTQGKYNVPDNFNHQLSSAVVTILQLQSQSRNSSCVTFYAHPVYGGNPHSFQLCSSGDLPSQYQDLVSSFRVPPGYSVTLYPDYNQGGQTYGPYTQGGYDISDGLNGQVGSAKIDVPQAQTQMPCCVTFYTEADESGDSFQLCFSGAVPSQYNDQASSFMVPTGCSVTLYSEYNYEGRTVGPYAEGAYDIPNNFSYRLRSAVINVTQPQNSSCVTFYPETNEKGNSFLLCTSGNVPDQYNVQVESLVVPVGFSVTLYSDSYYEGVTAGPYTQGSYNVPANFNGQLSSVIILGSQYQLQYYANCVIFYTDINMQGMNFRLCSSGDVPSQYKDQILSFVVPAGYYITLYQEYGYEGRSIGPYIQGFYNVPDSFTEQVSSVIINQGQPQNPTV